MDEVPPRGKEAGSESAVIIAGIDQETHGDVTHEKRLALVTVKGCREGRGVSWNSCTSGDERQGVCEGFVAGTVGRGGRRVQSRMRVRGLSVIFMI